MHDFDYDVSPNFPSKRLFRRPDGKTEPEMNGKNFFWWKITYKIIK